MHHKGLVDISEHADQREQMTLPIRTKHQKRASSTPPEKPLIPTASSKLAQPSRCLLHSLGEPDER